MYKFMKGLYPRACLGGNCHQGDTGRSARLGASGPRTSSSGRMFLNTLTGQWCNLLKVTRSGILSRHVHPAPVFGMVMKGNGTTSSTTGWRKKLFRIRAAGEIHTLNVPEDCDEMITFFNISGCMVYLEQGHSQIGYEDVFTKIDMCRAHYEQVGLGATMSISSSADTANGPAAGRKAPPSS